MSKEQHKQAMFHHPDNPAIMITEAEFRAIQKEKAKGNEEWREQN